MEFPLNPEEVSPNVPEQVEDAESLKALEV